MTSVVRSRAAIILFGASAALCAVFVIKTCVDYNKYVHTVNSAPFILWVVVNALCFVTSAAVLAAVGLFLLRKTKILALCAALCGALAVGVYGYVIARILEGSVSGGIYRIGDALLDGLPYTIPFVLAGAVFLIFALVSRNLQKKADIC